MKEFKPNGIEAMMLEHLIKKYEEAELQQMGAVNRGCETRDNIVVDTPNRTFHIEIKVKGYKRGEIPAGLVLGDTVEEHFKRPDGVEVSTPVLNLSNMPLPPKTRNSEMEAALRRARGEDLEADRLVSDAMEAAKRSVERAGFDFNQMAVGRGDFYRVHPGGLPISSEVDDIERRQREILGKTREETSKVSKLPHYLDWIKGQGEGEEEA
jgi:hypothetical protein